MNRKFLYLTKMSLRKKIGSKWFLIVNILLALAIIALFNINSIIDFFGGDFKNEKIIYIQTENESNYNLLKQNLESLNKNVEENESENFKISKTTKEEEKAKDSLKEDEILILLEENEEEILTAKIISKSKIDTMTYQVLVQSLNTVKQTIAFNNLNISPSVLATIQKPITIDRVVLNDEKSVDENINIIMSTVFPTVILPFFMLIIFLVQMVGGEICEEKTTKSMEIIISNVSPKTHLFSKILASNLFVIIQGLLLFLYALLGFIISTKGGSFSLPGDISSIWTSLVDAGFVKTLTYLIPLTLILMILSFLAYSLVAGILASMTTNMEDFQQIQTPIMLILLAGYYLAIMAGMFSGSTFIKILSYVPFLSCLVSPSLFMMGEIGIIDVLISIVILVIFIYLLVKFGLKIYKVGILNYSNEKVWSRFVKALRTKDI